MCVCFWLIVGDDFSNVVFGIKKKQIERGLVCGSKVGIKGGWVVEKNVL